MSPSITIVDMPTTTAAAIDPATVVVESITPVEPTPPTTTAADVAILGGGAGGVAVVLHLVQQAKKGKPLKDIIVIEKTATVGPGLAFSTDCTGTILNMHSDTMGILIDNPKDYTQWRTSLEDGPFPSRVNYGEYLQTRWSQAILEAETLGVRVGVIHQDAIEIDRLADGTHIVTLGNGSTVAAKSVVMAVGNFTGSSNAHLHDKPGYFPNPWPTLQLNVIPSEAHVLVVGSRLSAVDAALYLSENGHQGPITFMSRSGKLPKVQGNPIPYTRKYILHELARQVEENPNENLLQVASTIIDEISLATGGDWSWMIEKESHLVQLENDLLAAENQQIRWQSVLSSTAPLVERYWESLSTGSQKLFMDKFNSTWMSYRHAMPIKNASRILNLLKKGQLRVVAGDTITWDDGVFHSQTSAGVIDTPFVIEATGQECHIDKIDSPLVQSAVKRGLLKAHPAGGVEVDFKRLEASAGFYVMGSLTRGKHFYVSATDRVAAHASRIANALTNEPVSKHLHVALFVGSDLFSHLMASKLVPQLLRSGHVPYIFLDQDQENHDNQDKRAANTPTPELKELEFFEKELLQDHVIPYFKDRNPEDAEHMTVRQMQTKYGILVQDVSDVNDAVFIKNLATHHIDLGLSLHFQQQFKSQIVSYFTGGTRKLLNLHTGDLPSYRGVMTTIRAMKNNESHFGYSLHEITEASNLIPDKSDTAAAARWNTGAVVDIRRHPIDYSKSMLHYMNDVYALGVEMSADAINKVARGEELKPVTEETTGGTYYAIPTKEELEEYKQSGIRLVDAASMVQIVVDSFASSKKREAFQTYILSVVRDWSDKNCVLVQE